ncbi:MAG: DNA polymerase IV [Phycisphaerae bacterium]
MNRGAHRQIIHIDMDAFYAAVEQQDNPALRGKPVLVGGDPKGRGVVSTASYEARPYGCHSAMPMAQAVRLCPDAVIVRPRMGRYIEVSRRIFAAFEEFTPLVEPISIDEAFLDVTGSTRLFGPADVIARSIKGRIYDATHLTASAGVAPNKFLAKLASDLQKPDGLVVVHADQIRQFLDSLPVSNLWGVGKATLPKFDALGVKTFGDVRCMSVARLRTAFGETGEHFHQLVRGIDRREVIPDRHAKSISHETTFPVDVSERDYLRSVLLDLLEHAAARLRRHKRQARTVTVKIRTHDFRTFTRSATRRAPTQQTDELWESAAELFDAWCARRTVSLRLIGVALSHLADHRGEQLELFDQPGGKTDPALDSAVDGIRERFGHNAITRAFRADNTRP